jgi:putative transposase
LVHAYALMMNHVHLLVTPSCEKGVSKMMQFLGRSYVLSFNRIHRRSGTLWEGRFRSSCIADDRYLFACYRYIEMNPVNAGIVSTPDEYAWSSYRANALGVPNAVVKPSKSWIALGEDDVIRRQAYRRMFDLPEDATLVAEIRATTK